MASPSAPSRFKTTSDEDKARLLATRTPKSTSSGTTFWIGVFNEYLKQKEHDIDLKSVDPSILSGIIGSFYVDLRKKNGGLYMRNSYLAARSAIHRHISSIRTDMNIFSDNAFKRCNKLLDGLLKEKKRQGEEPAVKHKESISDCDWQLIDQYFADISDTKDPRKLTHYVWFHITSKFCLRGREIQSKLTKNDIVLKTVEGKEVFTLATDLSKNHQGGLAGSLHVSAGLIQEPVQIAAINFYLDKLNPDIDRFFQRAKVGVGCLMSRDDAHWYMKSPLSHNLLGSMMKLISESAKLSKPYTNHCLRATAVVHLKEAGVEDRTICEISGHKNPASLAAYDRVSPVRACELSAKIDNPASSSSVCKATLQAACVVSPLTDVTNAAPAPAAPAFVLNAAGATFSNVTFNVTPPPKKRRKLSLSLKKTRERLEMKKTLKG